MKKDFDVSKEGEKPHISEDPGCDRLCLAYCGGFTCDYCCDKGPKKNNSKKNAFDFTGKFTVLQQTGCVKKKSISLIPRENHENEGEIPKTRTEWQ